jgi:hypothetical protein
MQNYRGERPGADPSLYDQFAPHQRTHDELVTDVKAGLAAAQEEWERRNGPNTFDPVMWIGERLTTRTSHTHGKEYQKRSDLSLAWDAITLPYLRSDDYRSTVDTLNSSKVRARGSNVVSLDPQEIALIDAMTDVLGIPRPRRQESVEILRTDKQKQHFRELYGSIHARRCGI